jgi:hypothetical protein
MKPCISRLLAALALAGMTALPAAAQEIRPGLWEVTSQVGSAGGAMQAAMAMLQNEMGKMDPAQRAQVEAMMGKHGVALTEDGALRAKMCVTRDMAERFELPVQQNGNCSYRRSPPAGNKMKVAFTCTNPASSGEGEVTFNGDTNYRIRMTVNASGATVNTNGDARWLGADCGAIEPAAGR